MDDATKTAIIKSSTDEQDDSVISSFLEFSRNIVLNKLYPFISDENDANRIWLKRYDDVQVKICIYLLNKRGAEGQKAYSENNITRTYETGDIPDSILNEITPYAAGIYM
jgi:hypothetical protein